MPRWYFTAKGHLDELCLEHAQAVETSTASAAAADAAPPCAALPFVGSPDDKERLAAGNHAAWRLLERFRLQRDRPTARGYQRTSDEWESITDLDAAPMKKGGPLVLGYHDHYVVDGGKPASSSAPS